MLIFGRLVLCGQNIVPLDLTDDRQTMDHMLALAGGDAADLNDLIGLLRRAGFKLVRGALRRIRLVVIKLFQIVSLPIELVTILALTNLRPLCLAQKEAAR